MISDKVRPHHLERKAILYVRHLSTSGVAQPREQCVAIRHAGPADGARLVRDRIWLDASLSKELVYAREAGAALLACR